MDAAKLEILDGPPIKSVSFMKLVELLVISLLKFKKWRTIHKKLIYGLSEFSLINLLMEN
jgi:hypothetical protein